MTSGVHLFPGVSRPDAPLDQQPDQHVIELLEEYLAEARDGRIRAFAIAIVRLGEITSYGWSSGVGMSHAMFAAVADLFWENAASRNRQRTAPQPVKDPA